MLTNDVESCGEGGELREKVSEKVEWTSNNATHGERRRVGDARALVDGEERLLGRSHVVVVADSVVEVLLATVGTYDEEGEPKSQLEWSETTMRGRFAPSMSLLRVCVERLMSKEGAEKWESVEKGERSECEGG